MSSDICLHCTEYKSHQPYAQSVFMMWLIGMYSFIFVYHVAVSEELYSKQQYIHCLLHIDRLCGLVVRVSGYSYRGLGFDSRRCQIF